MYRQTAKGFCWKPSKPPRMSTHIPLNFPRSFHDFQNIWRFSRRDKRFIPKLVSTENFTWSVVRDINSFGINFIPLYMEQLLNFFLALDIDITFTSVSLHFGRHSEFIDLFLTH